MAMLGGPSLATEKILQQVAAERCRQDLVWGDERMHRLGLWYLILSEEVGEVAKAILEHEIAELRVELIQVAAVAVATIESLDRQLEEEKPC